MLWHCMHEHAVACDSIPPCTLQGSPRCSWSRQYRLYNTVLTIQCSQYSRGFAASTLIIQSRVRSVDLHTVPSLCSVSAPLALQHRTTVLLDRAHSSYRGPWPACTRAISCLPSYPSLRSEPYICVYLLSAGICSAALSCSASCLSMRCKFEYTAVSPEGTCVSRVSGIRLDPTYLSTGAGAGWRVC